MLTEQYLTDAVLSSPGGFGKAPTTLLLMTYNTLANLVPAYFFIRFGIFPGCLTLSNSTQKVINLSRGTRYFKDGVSKEKK